MDKQLSELKQQAEQKPGDAHAVHQLADAYEQMGWRFRDKTIQEWATLLQGEGWRPSSNAGDALGQIGIGAVPALIEVLACPSAAARSYAALALGRIGAHAKLAVKQLVKCLEDDDWRVRYSVVTSLGDIGSNAQQAVVHLDKLLKDPEPKVQEAAQAAINNIVNKLPAIPDADKNMSGTTKLIN
jgi:HEAT repeat protein